jgi:transcription elongation factor GreA
MTPAPSVLTGEGRRRLQAELDRLRNESRPEVRERLRAAFEAAHGDFGEMAEYQHLQMEQARLEARIAELEQLLARAGRVEAPAAPNGAAVGSTVSVRNDEGEEERYTLVPPAEADPRHGRIPVDSPVGRALLGRRAGGEVHVRTPMGTRHLVVLAVG